MSITPLVFIHIWAGMTALASGAAAMILAKGSTRHRLAGTVFVMSMLVMGGIGAAVAFMRGQTGNVMGGTMAVYLVATAWAAARRTKQKPGAFDWAACAFILMVGVWLAVNGWDVAHRLAPPRDGVPATAYFVIGTIALLCAAGDIRMLLQGGIFGAQRIARHVWRMSFALWFATASLFLGQQKVFPESLRGSPLLYAPVILVLILMIYWLLRIWITGTHKRKMKNAAHAVAHRGGEPVPS